MAKEFMHKTLKELFPDYIVLIKIETFYEAYGDDANILSFLFSYKTRIIGENISCGFPINSLNRIISILDRKSINYLVIDKSHNYEEEMKQNYKRKNNYNEILIDTNKYIDKINKDLVYIDNTRFFFLYFFLNSKINSVP